MFQAIEFISLLHGLLGTLFLMSFTGAIISLFNPDKKKYKLLRNSILIMTITVIVIDVLGIYLYGTYRAPGPQSAKSKILASDTPWVHDLLMEFKEFAGIYVALFMLLINFLVMHYHAAILEDKKLRNTIVLLLSLTMLLTLLTFGLGAYITKVQSI